MFDLVFMDFTIGRAIRRGTAGSHSQYKQSQGNYGNQNSFHNLMVCNEVVYSTVTGTKINLFTFKNIILRNILYPEDLSCKKFISAGLYTKMTMQGTNPQIEESWGNILQEEFEAPYFSELKQFLREEKKSQTIYPPGNLIFNAFNQTPFNRVKVVILGQDPYHGPGQAHGLCFSVPEGIPFPPSLQNIFKEIKSDLGIPVPGCGDLTPWARQGVLLINAILTVRADQPTSHQHKGWEKFTDAVIRNLSEKRKNLIFMLWGNYAQAKEILIDGTRHHILKAAHPSPLSASRGFFGCRHFSRSNEILSGLGVKEIDWKLV